MMKDPCSKEELYFTTDRAPKPSLDPGKEATTHCWAEHSVYLCLEQGFSSQPARYPGYCISINRLLYGVAKSEGRVMWACRPAPHFSPASPSAFPRLSWLHLHFGFKRQCKVQVPTLGKQKEREALLRQRRAALPGVLCPPNTTEPSPCQKSR